MKASLRRIAAGFRLPIDTGFSAAMVPCALLMLAYRRAGSQRLTMTTRVLKKMGVFPIRDHYYDPLFQESKLRTPLSDERSLPGIDLNDAGQLEMLRQLDRADELLALQWNRPVQSVEMFTVENGNFGSGDAEFLYQFLRSIKPAKVIEIGSGHSTKVTCKARSKNEESGHPMEMVCIEPYEMEWLERLNDVEVVRQTVETCEIPWEKALKAGDLLLIDSSHMIRPQGDVLHEYLNILPRLASGVYVHIHDIFTPRDYPAAWLKEYVFLWNEQYLLETLLSNRERYEVVAALNYLKHHHYDALKRVCPYLTPDREPGSFYLRVR
jgi:hypothetical protein